MKKIIILIPVFNDWESLKKLIKEINEHIKNFNDIHFECLIINDASTIYQQELIKPSHIKSLEILNSKLYFFLNNSFTVSFSSNGSINSVTKLKSKINSSPIFINGAILYINFKNQLVMLN